LGGLNNRCAVCVIPKRYKISGESADRFFVFKYMAKITSEILRATAPLTKKAIRDRFLPYLNLLLPHFEINNELRICAFLATCTLESAYWRATAEYGKGKGKAYGRIHKDTGKAYYGRGIIQNTWRDAYEDFTAYVKRNWSWLQPMAGVKDAPDFVQNPDLLTELFWAVLAACWFWHRNKLNNLADGGLKKFFAIQGITNRGDAEKKALHYADRLAIYETLRRTLPDNFALDPLKDSAVTQQNVPQMPSDIPTVIRDTEAEPAQAEQPPKTEESTPAENQLPSQSEPPSVEVEQIKAEQQAETEPTGIKASIAGAITFITTTGAGILTWIGGAKTEIIYGFFGASAVIGIVFIWRRFNYVLELKRIESKEKMEREQRAHELQMEMVKAAASKDMNTVTIKPAEIQNSDAPARGLLPTPQKLTWRQRIGGWL
jgi:putative chitinase